MAIYDYDDREPSERELDDMYDRRMMSLITGELVFELDPETAIDLLRDIMSVLNGKTPPPNPSGVGQGFVARDLARLHEARRLIIDSATRILDVESLDWR